MKFDEIDSNIKEETSAQVKERVNFARQIQLERFKDDDIYANSQMLPSHIKKYCVLGKEETLILKTAFEKLGLSARAYDRILKIARTIADLDNSENITKIHILEAISYRKLDREQ